MSPPFPIQVSFSHKPSMDVLNLTRLNWVPFLAQRYMKEGDTPESLLLSNGNQTSSKVRNTEVKP